jgi:peptidyl-dipeptidase A
MHRLCLLAAVSCLTNLPLVLLGAPSPSAAPAAGDRVTLQERADRFLTLMNSTYKALYTVNNEAQWKSMTDVTPEHDAATEAAGKAYAAFNGDPTVIQEARELLNHKDQLNDLTVRQLKRVLLNAAENPMTNPVIVTRRIAAETRQAWLLTSNQLKFRGKPITDI